MRNLYKLNTILLAGGGGEDITARTLGTGTTDDAIGAGLYRQSLLSLIYLLTVGVPSVEISTVGVARIVLTLTNIAVVAVLVLGESPTALAEVALAELVHLDTHIRVAIFLLSHQGLLGLLKNTYRRRYKHAQGYCKHCPCGNALYLALTLADEHPDNSCNDNVKRDNVGCEQPRGVILDVGKTKTLKGER